ncbi:uncharacterized protein B4U80_12851 [Leptotrombidium deliense]|uniref:Pyruvate phosphate dikinase AMP/ATP-binding domain-containing protein n=1 Tax=Leptotrombidium deliense TaxID=299467 RepID=A0A443SJJ4_9ACAR|nr:uncharacterized protein B4U80_12851 [Leptotrombidium deliense]
MNSNSNIFGQWLQQWKTNRSLQQKQKENKDRIEFYDFEKTDDPYICGFIPSEKEWNIEKPDYEKDEHICITAVNSKEQFLRLSIFKSKEVNGKVEIKLQLSLKITESEEYSIEEQYFLSVIGLKPNEYKCGPLSIEILSPFRKLRIKFRGYLKNENTGEFNFAQLRLHWYSLSNVFDHKCSFDSNYIAKQLVKNNSKTIEVEDRIEQFGNIKGTVKIESESEKQIFLWGLRSKNICDKGLRASRLIGIAMNGIAFDVGFISNDVLHYSYSYGLVKNSKGIVEAISQSQNEMLSFANNCCEIVMKTSKHRFVVMLDGGNKYLRNAKIDGFETKCITLNDDYKSFFDNLRGNQSSNVLHTYPVSDIKESSSDLVLTLDNIKAQNVNLSGGKGSSLVALTRLSEISNRFKVPKGLIVTSNAYNILLEENNEILQQLQKLEKLTWYVNYFSLLINVVNSIGLMTIL